MNPKLCIIDSLTIEERELLYFAEPAGYQMRLQQYLEYPQGFATRTTLPKSKVSLSTTKTFRSYLHRFIRNFQAEPLFSGSNLWLHIEKSGRFSLRLGENGEEIADFSEADFCLFQYLCFLHLRRFWDDVRKCCGFPVAMLPVLIPDFSERLEKGVDFNALLQRAFSAASSIVVL